MGRIIYMYICMFIYIWLRYLVIISFTNVIIIIMGIDVKILVKLSFKFL